MAKTKGSGRIKKDLLDFNSPSRPLRPTTRKQRKVTGQLNRFRDNPDLDEEEVDDFTDDEESVGVESEDSFVVGDNVIIMDTDSEEESDDDGDDDILNQVKGLRSSSQKSSTSKRKRNSRCSSHVPRSVSRSRSLRSSSTNASPKKKKRRKLIESDDDQFEQEEEEVVDLSDGDVTGAKRFKCYNPSCNMKVCTPKDMKKFCAKCSLWEHAFYMSTNDCKRNGDMRCFYCEQIRHLRGCRSMRYQNQEELAPIVVRKGDSVKDFPHPDQRKWKFYWNKFMKTTKDERCNVKLGDCIRIKERKGTFSYLVRVNYIIVDGSDETWISGYRIIDLHSKEINKIPKDDFVVDNRDFRKVFPNQQFFTKETSYYSLKFFEVIELVACVWYKEYYDSLRGFPEESIFPAVFNYYTDTKEIEFIEIPDWRVCEYEFIGSKQEKDRKSVGVSTDDIPLYTIEFESRLAITDGTEVGTSSMLNSETKAIESGTRVAESGTRTEAIGASPHQKSPGMSTRTARIDTFTSPIRVKQEPIDTNESIHDESTTEESVPTPMDVALAPKDQQEQQPVNSTRNESSDAPVTVPVGPSTPSNISQASVDGSNTPFSVTSKKKIAPFSVSSKEKISPFSVSSKEKISPFSVTSKEKNLVHGRRWEQECDEDLEWPDEEQEERLAKERQARELLKTCLLTRTPLVIHPDIDLSEPATEIKVSWKLPL